ncbi:hypothetical protein MNB_SM-3-802 [hydrothermal vent metagenome]|uniref:Outer membrane protein beta-barrel domain-containing protein n=1 Tax=hydrothermal vent metagenome TaxID=652676 RepID=A0A1W1D621_9ZZZZ
MKIVRSFVLLFFLLQPFLYATPFYVKIANTKSVYLLQRVKNRLNSVGLNMVYTRSPRSYSIYSGPYEKKLQATFALLKIKKIYPQAILIESKKEKKTKKEKKFYSSFALGYSSAPSTHTILSGTVKIKEPKNSGVSYILEGGMSLPYHLRAGVGYMHFSTSDLVFHNFYGVVDYSFRKYNFIEPYFGVLVGYSALTWNVDPIPNPSKNSSNDSTSPFYGTEAGISYKKYPLGDIFVEYQCLFMEHTTNIELDKTNRSKLQHKILHSLIIGFKYHF